MKKWLLLLTCAIEAAIVLAVVYYEPSYDVRGVLWRDCEVVRRGGPPQLQLHGGAARRFAAMGAKTSLLTITHSEALALAEVLILGE